jgi:hypothetical protein
MVAYSSFGGTTAKTVNLSSKFPCVAIDQCCKDSLGNLRRRQEYFSSSRQIQTADVCQICRDSIDGCE